MVFAQQSLVLKKKKKNTLKKPWGLKVYRSYEQMTLEEHLISQNAIPDMSKHVNAMASPRQLN